MEPNYSFSVDSFEPKAGELKNEQHCTELHCLGLNNRMHNTEHGITVN